MGFQVGFVPVYVQVLVGLSGGVLLGVSEFVLLKPPAISSGLDPAQSVVNIVFLMMLISFSEEMLFRGLLQGSLSKVLSPWAAIQVVSIQFGLMHLGWRSVPEVLFAYATGLLMGFMFWKSESLMMPILLHGAGNVVMFLLASIAGSQAALPYLLSGSAVASMLSGYLLKKHMPLDAWSAWRELQRRRKRTRELLAERT